jgi:predicted nucleic acid-binding protein
MIYVDTSAWFALYDVRDANHQAALGAVRSCVEPLITTDFVVAETLTLFRARGANRRAIEFGKELLETASTTIVRIELHDYLEAWTIFRNFHDKDWSFTDCTSLVVMQHLGIQMAFAFDDHFRQFGTVIIVP